MYIDFTSTAMIDNIKTRAMIPSSQNLFTPSVLVKMITAELLSDIVPMIMSCREEHFVHHYDQSFVGGQNNYEIPARAIGQKLRDACLVNSSNREVSLPRLDPDQLKHQWFLGNYSLYMNRKGFFFRDGYVTIFPDADSMGSYTFRMKYFRRPNNICTESEAGQVALVNTVTKEVTLNRCPSSWTSSSTFDVIKGQPGFRSLADDATISSIDTGARVLTFTTLPAGIAVGDWVALSGFSPITQIPYEVFPILEQRVVIKVLEDMKDSEGLKNAADVYKDMVDKFKTLVSPRADGSPKRIVRSSALFGDRRYRGNWW